MIEERCPHIIHVTRENVTRQGVSFGYQQLVRQGKLPYHPVHSFRGSRPEPVIASPKEITAYALKVKREMAQGAARLAAYTGRVLALTYEDMVGDRESWLEPDTGYRIEDFLDVEHIILQVALRRDFPAPMAEWFANWPEIRAALKAAGLGGLDG